MVLAWRGWRRFPVDISSAFSDDYEFPFVANAGLATTVRVSGEPVLFASGPDFKLYRTFYAFSSNSWQDWQEVAGEFHTDTSVTATPGSPIILTARSMEDNLLYSKWADNFGAWPKNPAPGPPDFLSEEPAWHQVPGMLHTDVGVATTLGWWPFTFAKELITGRVMVCRGWPVYAPSLSPWSEVPVLGWHTFASNPDVQFRTAVAPAVNLEADKRALLVAVQRGTQQLFWNALEFGTVVGRIEDYELGWTGWNPIVGDYPFASDDRPEPFRTDASACVIGDHVFAKGPDNYVYQNDLSATGATWEHQRPTAYRWSGWQRIGELQTGLPVAGIKTYTLDGISPAQGGSQMYWLFARGLDRRLYVNVAPAEQSIA
jgi:hypothetical protein